MTGVLYVLPLAMSFCISLAHATSNTPVMTSTTPIKSEMQAIAETWSQLGSQIEDKSKNPSSISLVDTLIAKSKAASSQIPKKAAGDYQKQMGMMIEKLTAVKTALAKNDNATAKKTFDELKQWSAADHAKKYQ